MSMNHVHRKMSCPMENSAVWEHGSCQQRAATCSMPEESEAAEGQSSHLTKGLSYPRATEGLGWDLDSPGKSLPTV